MQQGVCACVHKYAYMHKCLYLRFAKKQRKTHAKDFIRVLIYNYGIKRSHEQTGKTYGTWQQATGLQESCTWLV